MYSIDIGVDVHLMSVKISCRNFVKIQLQLGYLFENILVPTQFSGFIIT